jgi:hypothetical protein
MSKKIEKQILVHHRIKNISLVSFKIFSFDADKAPVIDPSKLIFGISVDFKIDANSGIINILAHFDIVTDDLSKLLVGQIESLGEFKVENMEEVLKAHSGKFPNEIITIFIGALISTTRGFYILKSVNTILEGTMLPIVDPRKLVDQFSEHKINK